MKPIKQKTSVLFFPFVIIDHGKSPTVLMNYESNIKRKKKGNTVRKSNKNTLKKTGTGKSKWLTEKNPAKPDDSGIGIQ